MGGDPGYDADGSSKVLDLARFEYSESTVSDCSDPDVFEPACFAERHTGDDNVS